MIRTLTSNFWYETWSVLIYKFINTFDCHQQIWKPNVFLVCKITASNVLLYPCSVSAIFSKIWSKWSREKKIRKSVPEKVGHQEVINSNLFFSLEGIITIKYNYYVGGLQLPIQYPIIKAKTLKWSCQKKRNFKWDILPVEGTKWEESWKKVKEMNYLQKKRSTCAERSTYFLLILHCFNNTYIYIDKRSFPST